MVTSADEFIHGEHPCKSFYSVKYVFYFSVVWSGPLCKVKVKQPHYRPRQALRGPRGWGSQICRQSAHEGGKVVSPTHRPPLPPRKYSWYSFLLRGWVDPRAIVRLKRLCQGINSNDTIGNRTHDVPVCSVVPQPTAPPRAPDHSVLILYITTQSTVFPAS
jgi:hypothetical protein